MDTKTNLIAFLDSKIEDTKGIAEDNFKHNKSLLSTNSPEDVGAWVAGWSYILSWRASKMMVDFATIELLMQIRSTIASDNLELDKTREYLEYIKTQWVSDVLSAARHNSRSTSPSANMHEDAVNQAKAGIVSGTFSIWDRLYKLAE
jgi:hypothetical protein